MVWVTKLQFMDQIRPKDIGHHAILGSKAEEGDVASHSCNKDHLWSRWHTHEESTTFSSMHRKANVCAGLRFNLAAMVQYHRAAHSDFWAKRLKTIQSCFLTTSLNGHNNITSQTMLPLYVTVHVKCVAQQVAALCN